MRSREIEVREDSGLFAEMCAAVLCRGHSVQFQVQGESMRPNLLDGDVVVVSPADSKDLCLGDVALTHSLDGLRVHRIAAVDSFHGSIVTRGDSSLEYDPLSTHVFGRVIARHNGERRESFGPIRTRVLHPLSALVSRVQLAAARRLRRVATLMFGIMALLLFCGTFSAPAARAQTADLQLIQTASASAIAAGSNFTYSEVVKNNASSAAVTAGTITVYMQTPANTTYQSYAGGANWTCSHPTAGNAGPLICTYNNVTLASGATATALSITFQVIAGTASGTTIQGSVTVTNSTFVDTVPSNNTSLTSIYVEPTTTSDLALSMSVSPTPVFVSSTLTYTILVQNLGQLAAPATANVFTDVLPSGVTYVSSTASAGWSCAYTVATTTVACSITSAMAMGSTATITISGTAQSTATTLTSTATVTLPGDPNSANNSATAYTVVQPLVCATPGRDGAGGTLTGIINAYYPPSTTGTLASASNSVVLGAAAVSGAQTPIASGDLLLIIQMQGAAINATNTSSYAHGVPGDPASGSIINGSSGLFEFVTATNLTPVPVTGGTLQFTGTGPTGGLLNSYYYALPSTVSLGTATAATWAGNIATFTFPPPLPASVVPYSVLTTTGFTPAGYNFTNAIILSVNNATGVITVAQPTNLVTATTRGTGSSTSQGQQTYQVIRVPQYTSATLSAGLVPLPWNGSVGGVLALDASSQLTLGGTVTLDALGFRGAGGRILTGAGTGAVTDYVTLATNPANASKGEGIAGTPRYIAPATIIATTTATDTTGGNPSDTLPGGSYARGAPGNAGGGGTDGNAAGNTENSGGGAGGNGGTGGQGGYGWNSLAATNSTDGGFGGVGFPASTSALVMGGGGGAGTTNNGSYYTSSANGANCGASCTGIYSSGGAGGGIAIIHAGTVVGTGTITSNGQSTLSTLNDSTGGGGAGGSILVYANSGGLGGLTATANGGSGGNAWPTTAPGGFPGQRHGPGGGGGGGIIFLTGSPASGSVAGGSNGYTNTVQDSYGASPGSAGLVATNLVITETPGTQSGAYCASADLSVTNSGTPAVVLPGGAITYTQTLTNNGPLDAISAVFSETTPVNTTFQSINTAAAPGWTCGTVPAVGGTGTISCTNPDFANGGTGSFTVTVQVNSGTVNGTQIVDIDNITSGTTDPNLANNTAIAVTTVGVTGTADLVVTNTSSSPTTLAGSNVTMTGVVTNQGPSAASGLAFTETIPANTTLGALFVPPASWSCNAIPVGGTGTLTCTIATLASGGTATFPLILNVNSGTASGTIIQATDDIASPTPDSNPSNNSATASTVVATAGQADLAVASSAIPNPVLGGNNITYTQSVTNYGPTSITIAGATTVTFTDTIPANTTLATLFTPPAGWSCNSIAVGGTGTFTCTLNSGQTLNSGASVNFPLVVKVNPATAPGTIITNSPGVASTVGDPNSANNTATVTTVVASPTQAFVSIVKTVAPDPVDQGTNLTYTIQVTNSGPAVAQGITVTDPLPSQVTETSASMTLGGTCNYPPVTTPVSCTLGSLGVGSVAIITINATATTFSGTTVTCNGVTNTYNACNTATLTTTTSNPNPVTSASAGSTIAAPTAVEISSFHAFLQPDGSALLEWRTHEESRNLGFHVYQEDLSGRHRLTPSLIAGSALLLRGSRPQHAAKLYRWLDAHPARTTGYWIEDVDINGARALHGPVYPEPLSAGQAPTPETPKSSPLLSQLRATGLVSSNSPRALRMPRPISPDPPPASPRFNAADYPGVKISVDQEGWYHIPLAQLLASGLNPNTNLRSLHLYAEGVEQPLLLTSGSSTPASAADAVEFYGTGIDTPFSATRIYWLVAENNSGKRILELPAPISGTITPASFAFTVIREDRTTYFAALLNGENNDNFFGAVVTSEPLDQDLFVAHADASLSSPISLELTLQGGSEPQPHSVSVQFNGATVGTMDFPDQLLATQSFPVDASLLLDGANSVTLTALNGDNDVSVVQSIQLHYAHTYAADANWLRATASSGSLLHVTGFTNPQIRVIDITDPLNISELVGKVSANGGAYVVDLSLPAGTPSLRTILAFSNDTLSKPQSLTRYTPTFLDKNRVGGDIVVISHPDFVSALAPLVRLRESQGHHVALVTTDQIYDEYNFGERSPLAIRTFLSDAVSQWQRKPQSVLLVGDASFDPRNYLGLGKFDFVPTRMIETAAFKTASDDWFTDFLQNGYATLSTGRLPVQTLSDANLVVSKIINYENGSYVGEWNSQALFVADQNIDANFTSTAASAAVGLPSFLQVSKIFANDLDPASARSQILSALNTGALLVNYDGHGAEQQWSFSDFFNTQDAAALTNGGRLPVYLLMDCLNGFFQDVYAQSLAESLLLAPTGGAVAVWASSGFTNQPPQSSMNQAFLHQFASHPHDSLGSLVLFAKKGTTDNDVRRTWILFGDPAMKFHLVPSPSASSPQSSIPPVFSRPCGRDSVCSREMQPQ